jgi:hypothetical protein
MKSFRALIPILLATVCSLVFGRYGFSDTDDGFITGLAWRILHGQIIYRDFIYVRPPLTPLLHALFMRIVPIDDYVISERALTYALILGSSYFATFALRNIFSADMLLRDHAWLYTSAFFVFSTHNLSPPFAWHTIDGVFFSAAGAWLLTKGRRVNWLAASGAAALFMAAAFTKQSFYPMPLAGIVCLWITRRKLSAVLPYLTTCCTLMLALLLALRHAGALGAMLYQTRSAAHLQDALDAGLWTYVLLGAAYLGICLIAMLCIHLISAAIHKGEKRPAFGSNGLIVFLTLFVLLNGFLVMHNLIHHSIAFIAQPPLGYSQAMFLIAAFFGARELREDFARGVSFILLLTVAWCASVSWGYETPLFFAAPLIYGLVRLTTDFAGGRLPERRALWMIFGTGVMTFALCNLYPYRDLDGRLHDHRDLGQLIPRLSGVKAGDREWAKLTEFLILEHEYGDCFVTLPAFTTSHFLTGTTNPAPTGWALNAEMANQTAAVFDALSAENVYAIVDIQQQREDATAPARYRSDLSSLVQNRWQLLKRGTWYQIYAAPKYSKRPAADAP